MIRIENSVFQFTDKWASIGTMYIDARDGDEDSVRLLALLQEILGKATREAIVISQMHDDPPPDTGQPDKQDRD